MLERIPIVGPSVPNQSVQVNDQLNVNLYLKGEGPGAKSAASLYHTPGRTALNTSTGDGRSNGVEWKNKLYFVRGDKFISIDDSNTVTEHGTLNTSTGRVVMAAGQTYMCIVDGTNGYTWNGTTFATITDVDFPDDTTHVAYLDGFFLVFDYDTDDFYKSALEDPTSWGSLDFETASASPDNILAVAEYDRDFYAIGSKSTQAYFNSGNADFPFSAYPRVLQLGILAPFSVVRTSFGLFWLANIPDGDAVVVKVIGNTYEVVSDADTSAEISRLANKSDAIGSVYTQEGHTFYVLTFPTDQLTKVYDVTQKAWHDRKTYPLGKVRDAGIGYLNGRVISVDFTNGKLYKLDRDVYTDDTDRIERTRRTQVIHVDRRRFTVWRVELEFQAGVGTGSGQGEDPQCMMKFRWDNDQFSSERWQSIGKIGERNQRMVWNKCGLGVAFEMEMTVTDPVPVTIVQGYMEIEVHD